MTDFRTYRPERTEGALTFSTTAAPRGTGCSLLGLHHGPAAGPGGRSLAARNGSRISALVPPPG